MFTEEKKHKSVTSEKYHHEKTCAINGKKDYLALVTKKWKN